MSDICQGDECGHSASSHHSYGKCQESGCVCQRFWSKADRDTLYDRARASLARDCAEKLEESYIDLVVETMRDGNGREGIPNLIHTLRRFAYLMTCYAKRAEKEAKAIKGWTIALFGLTIALLTLTGVLIWQTNNLIRLTKDAIPSATTAPAPPPKPIVISPSNLKKKTVKSPKPKLVTNKPN
jgi:hypothetical protein